MGKVFKYGVYGVGRIGKVHAAIVQDQGQQIVAIGDDVQAALTALGTTGVTRCLPTLITSPFDAFAAAARVLARADDPAVAGLHNASVFVAPGAVVALDGTTGEVVVDPDHEELEQGYFPKLHFGDTLALAKQTYPSAKTAEVNGNPAIPAVPVTVPSVESCTRNWQNTILPTLTYVPT